MWQYLAAVTMLGASVAGCSLIYNPNNIGVPDGKYFDAPPVYDADPAMLTVLDVQPATIYSGEGSNSAAPATIVIHGHNFVDAGLAVRITDASGSDVSGINVVTPPQRASDGDYIAMQVAVDTTGGMVDTGAGSATAVTHMLTVTVNEDGANAPASATIALSQLPVLVATGAVTLDPGALAGITFQDIAIGSAADVSGSGAAPTVTIKSTGQLILTAMSSITIDESIAANGVTGAVTPGPGGSPGGGAGQSGSPSGAGGGGVGGGGGYGTGGANGGGVTHGDPAISSYTDNVSGGGGGGAPGGGTGGIGAGGGGSVELTAGGNIAINAPVTVNGGTGGNGALAVLGVGGGGGGGGSGGVLVLRSRYGAIALKGTTPLTASGGGGGSPAGGTTGTGVAGGAGGDGRVRIDSTATTPPKSTPASHQSPVFAPTTQTIVTTATPMVSVLGTKGDQITLYTIDASGMTHDGGPNQTGTFDDTKMLTLPTALQNGYNTLCATLSTGARGDSLADVCTTIVLLP